MLSETWREQHREGGSMKEPKPRNTQRRLQILGTDEIEAACGMPALNQEERIRCFSLSPAERAALNQLHTVKSKTCFILQLSYFKAQRQFFVFDSQTVSEDAQFVQELHFPNAARITDLSIAKGTSLQQQQIILALLQYRTCGDIERQALAAKADQVARGYSKPNYVFRELMQYLASHRLVALSCKS